MIRVVGYIEGLKRYKPDEFDKLMEKVIVVRKRCDIIKTYKSFGFHLHPKGWGLPAE